MIENEEVIEVIGARVHNLKDVSIKIPRNQLVVMTGVSGSGKSSLAFDTIYAEGQRRYLETFSAYARQFLGTMERPDVDKINGLSPVIAIEQKTISKNPRSTVGTITEIYDFFRLLYARVANAYSYNTGELMVKFTTNQIVDLIVEQYQGKKILLLAPIIKGRKGHYKELFAQFMKQGFLKVRIDGELMEMHPKMQLDRYKIHDIELVVDQLKVKNEDYQRILASVETTLKLGDDSLMVYEFQVEEDKKNPPKFRLLSKKLMCPTTGIL